MFMSVTAIAYSLHYRIRLQYAECVKYRITISFRITNHKGGDNLVELHTRIILIRTGLTFLLL